MKIFVAVGMLLFSFGVFAQDGTSYIEFKNQGNEALKAKNYAQALELYENSYKEWPEGEEMDAAMVFNMATSARRADNDEKAYEYYTKSVELGYKADFAAFYLATALENMGKEEEMVEVLTKALEEHKTSGVIGHIKKKLTTYYLKRGAEYYNNANQIISSAASADPSQYAEITQKANEAFAEAKPWFEKVLEIDASNQNAETCLREIDTRLADADKN